MMRIKTIALVLIGADRFAFKATEDRQLEPRAIRVVNARGSQ